jgi:DnaJ-class molecular chaperone
VQCEECHGPGSLHANNPTKVDMKIQRENAACQSCHPMGKVNNLEIKDNFIRHQDQYGDLPLGKHSALECVTCHDPHSGVVEPLERGLSPLQTSCETCHFKQRQNQKVVFHANFQCMECHMPYMIKSAWGNSDSFNGDVRTHRVVIDPNQIEQFSGDGELLSQQISLNFACRHCHIPGSNLAKSDQELINAANNYHSQP